MMDDHVGEHVWRILANTLQRPELGTVFGLMGDANMEYVCELRRGGGRFVAAADEGAAVAMADGYARASGRVGIASVTHGPGFTNTVTALVEAARNGSELLVITGSAPDDPHYPQRLDLAAMATASEAGYVRVRGADHVVADLSRTLQRIVGEQRPYVLDVPAGLMRTRGLATELVVPRRPGPVSVEVDDLDGALGLLLSANRPLILAGWGAVHSGAREALVDLADRTGAALATTLRARDLFRGHPRDVGIFGSLSHSLAAEVIAGADLVAAFGASLNTFTTFGGELLRDARVLHVDDDPTRIGTPTPVDEAVVADARLAAERMNEALDAAGHRPRGAWSAELEERLRHFDPAAELPDHSGQGTVDLRQAMVALDRLLPAERTVVCDVGRFTVGVWPHLRAPGPEHLINMGAFASVGLGLDGAIGVATARPEQLTVAVVGDGGFMMSPVEIATAVRELPRFVLIVCNDGAYGAEYYRLDGLGFDRRQALNHWPDLGPVAEALGATVVTVTSLDDLAAAGPMLEQIDGVTVVDLRLDPEVNVIDW